MKKGNNNNNNNQGTYPKILPGRLANQSILVFFIKEQNPVVSNNRDNGEERRNIELDFELGLVTLGISLVSSAFYVAPLAITPSLVEDADSSAIRLESVGGPCVDTILGLKK